MDEVNLCYRGSVDGSVDIDRRPADNVYSRVLRSESVVVWNMGSNFYTLSF
jgi:hypothetical protein